jgi:hypothetical protein
MTNHLVRIDARTVAAAIAGPKLAWPAKVDAL